MDYSHVMVPHKDKRVKIFYEFTSPFHMHQVNMTYCEVKELDGLIKYLHLEDDNTINFLNSIEEVGLKNYVIIELDTLLPTLMKK